MPKQPRYFRTPTIHNGKRVVKYLAHVGGMTDHEVGDLIDAIIEDMESSEKITKERKLGQGRIRPR